MPFSQCLPNVSPLSRERRSPCYRFMLPLPEEARPPLVGCSGLLGGIVPADVLELTYVRGTHFRPINACWGSL
jgi:hypothetical protein